MSKICEYLTLEGFILIQKFMNFWLIPKQAYLGFWETWGMQSRNGKENIIYVKKFQSAFWEPTTYLELF